MIGGFFIVGDWKVADASSAWRDLYEPNSIAIGFPDDVPIYSICGNIREYIEDIAFNANLYISSGRLALVQSLPVATALDTPIIAFLLPNLRDAAIAVSVAKHSINTLLFSGEEHDICVSVPSATDDFSQTYSTKYDGKDYRHDKICKQNDIGEEILALLKGPKSAFKTFASAGASSASLTEFHASDSLDELAAEFEGLRIITDAMTLEADKEVLNIVSGNTEQVKLDVTRSSSVSGDVIIALADKNGVRFLSLEEGASSALLTFSENECGMWNISCFAQGSDGNIYMSNAKRIAVNPAVSEDDISSLVFSDSAGRIFLKASSDVPAGLYAVMKSGKTYDVSSPLSGTVWTFSNEGVVSVTDAGRVRGLQAGDTVMTAEYLGLRASVNAVVSSDVAVSEENAGNDISDEPDNTQEDNSGGEGTGIPPDGGYIDNNTNINDRNTHPEVPEINEKSSGGGGCTAGIFGSILLLILPQVIKRSKH